MKEASFFHAVLPGAANEIATRATAASTAASVDLSGANELGDLVRSGERFFLVSTHLMYCSLTASAVTISETAETGATKCMLVPAGVPIPFHFHVPSSGDVGDAAKYVFNYLGTATGRWYIYRGSRKNLN